jgi:cutinase
MRILTAFLTIAAPAALIGAPSAALIASAPMAHSAPCPDVELIFARGTSEPVGAGRVGQALASQLAPQLGGRSLGIYGVNYPATYDFLAAADGAADATNRIAAMSQQCPSTRYVLGGYSQGAAVVDMLVGIPPLGDKIGEIGSAPPLPPILADKVAAVAVFGNPSAKFGKPVSIAMMPFAGKGIDLCNDGDPICSQGRNPFAHTSYEKTPLVGQAAGFVSSLL